MSEYNNQALKQGIVLSILMLSFSMVNSNSFCYGLEPIISEEKNKTKVTNENVERGSLSENILIMHTKSKNKVMSVCKFFVGDKKIIMKNGFALSLKTYNKAFIGWHYYGISG